MLLSSPWRSLVTISNNHWDVFTHGACYWSQVRYTVQQRIMLVWWDKGWNDRDQRSPGEYNKGYTFTLQWLAFAGDFLLECKYTLLSVFLQNISLRSAYLFLLIYLIQMGFLGRHWKYLLHYSSISTFSTNCWNQSIYNHWQLFSLCMGIMEFLAFTFSNLICIFYKTDYTWWIFNWLLYKKTQYF